jgi:hypothetical protein
MTGELADVCLVFDPAEVALAEAVALRMADAGVTPVTRPAEVTPGEDFAETIRQTVGTTRAMALLMSPTAATSQVVAAFAGAAWAVELPIFVLRNNVRPSQYSPFYRRFPSFSLWSGFSRFVKAVGRAPERAPA